VVMRMEISFPIGCPELVRHQVKDEAPVRTCFCKLSRSRSLSPSCR
jgi:hypothetical protein